MTSKRTPITLAPKCHSSILHRIAIAVLALLVGWSSAQATEPPKEGSPRWTPLVKVIQQIEPAVVGLFTPIGNNQISSGSGTVIHPLGYVLTNNHVVPEPQGFALFKDSKKARFEVVSRYPESDIAIVRLLDVGLPLATIPLGRSDDSVPGEPIVVAGNPGGRGLVYTSGILSANDVLEGGPNAIVMSNYVNDRRERLLQFDAASNKGNSGGPLVNMEGEIIGIVSAIIEGEQNIGLAIPIDRARKLIQRTIEPEWTHGKTSGIVCDPLAKEARIVSIQPGEPAGIGPTQTTPTAEGPRVGDKLIAVEGESVRDGIDWILMQENLLPSRDRLKLRLERDGIPIEIEQPLMSIRAIPSDNPEQPQKGLKYRFYEGKFNAMPDFDKLSPSRSGITDTFDVNAISMGQMANFAITLNGYAAIESDGLYRIVLISDDGSQLYLNDQLFIDNDGNHPPKPSGRLVRLTKGMLPLRVDYFQVDGERSLFVVIERCEDRKRISLKDMKLLQGERLQHVPENRPNP